MPDTLIGGRYRLLEILGTGGEAKVWLAHDTVADRRVAARLSLRPTTYAPAIQLPPPHPGWVQLYKTGTDPRPWQIFELLEGPTLQKLIASGPLDSERWLEFVKQSLAAVGYLHEADWVHGDLNAGNFMLAGSENQQWRLLELPFLRFTPPTSRSPLFGSIHTLAPEQIDGMPADVRSDLYALGCLYYYAASGVFPHAGNSSSQIAIERLRFDPVPLVEKVPGFFPPGNDLVMALLARQPENRPPSVAAARHLLGIA